MSIHAYAEGWFLKALLVTLLGVMMVLFLQPAAQPEEDKLSLSKEPATGYQTIEELVVAIPMVNRQRQPLEAKLHVEILDENAKVLLHDERAIKQTDWLKKHSIRFKSPERSPKGLTLRYRLGEEKREVTLLDILRAQPHETSLIASKELYAGSMAALRCEVHGIKSVTETVPLADAKVVIRLLLANEKHMLYEGQTGKDGVANVRFEVPKITPGKYTLEVRTESKLGEETLTHEVMVKDEPKVMIVTDKPLYQPGQTMHIRALCLDAVTMRAVGESALTFEIEDSKGNKVFKRERRTNAFGVSSIDFELAREVNQGDYRIRALVGDRQAQKTVTVKPYVLPKFKVDVKADKTFYLPGQTLKADLQVDYFFGKPVAEGKVEVTASAEDVGFNAFHTWYGTLDKNGHAKVEIKLPTTFVKQPLSVDSTMVRIEVRIIDTAGQIVKVRRSYPVSRKEIQVSLIPESGKLVPGVENRVFVATVYPDGRPARADVSLWKVERPSPVLGALGALGASGALGIRDFKGSAPSGKNAEIGMMANHQEVSNPPKEKPKESLLAKIKTNETGLASFVFTPHEDDFYPGGEKIRAPRLLYGEQSAQLDSENLLNIRSLASDGQGNRIETMSTLRGEPLGENLLLRCDQAIYEPGAPIKLEVLSSGDQAEVHLDVIYGEQILCTESLRVKAGKVSTQVRIPDSVAGTLELHVYQLLSSGEIIGDSRLIYIQPSTRLKVEVQADRKIHRPGERGSILFQVTDNQGAPAQAALGVMIVDEAVYALQEMKPETQHVYFTLREELLTSASLMGHRPDTSIRNMVCQESLSPSNQQIAQVLFTATDLGIADRWYAAPKALRITDSERQCRILTGLLYTESMYRDVLNYDPKAKQWKLKEGVLAEVVNRYGFKPNILRHPFGTELTEDQLSELSNYFTPEKLGHAITKARMARLAQGLLSLVEAKRDEWVGPVNYRIPPTVLMDQAIRQHTPGAALTDAWGQPFRWIHRQKAFDPPLHERLFIHYRIASSGPDRKPDTKDDLILSELGGTKNPFNVLGPERDYWDRRTFRIAMSEVRGKRVFERFRHPQGEHSFPDPGGYFQSVPNIQGQLGGRVFGVAGIGGFSGFGGGLGEMPGGEKWSTLTKKTDPFTPAPARTRSYFPETMLWQPTIITDERGEYKMPVDFADSITTWRLTASASSKHGHLGGVTAPLRVFQDFFIDMDLPLHLTQKDEVTFPVAVYNYLKEPQTVTISLEKAEWYDLVDGTPEREIKLNPGEVASVQFRIRAAKIGDFPLTVKARGSKMSDAVRRIIEVVPDGAQVEQVVTEQLKDKASKTIHFPKNAIADSEKLFVKIHPGIFSQVMEGAEGMMRMPNGCFEQTTSAAYPNVLIVDYIKKTRAGAPDLLTRAEKYLNVGYQRLLTFERPGGGFDLWGKGTPEVWLSAYGLQEFSDMAKVYPIDRAIIERTQKYLMGQQGKDGTWSDLMLTSYVTWSLLESGYKDKRLDQSLAYILEHAKESKNAYILALAANALAANDPKDARTLDVVQRLHKFRKDLPKINACCFPSEGQSLSYGRGDYLTVETTALTVLAMMRTGQFNNDVNRALTYLIQSKEGGTWGSTQATILALKALVQAAGGQKPEGNATFLISINGAPVAEGTVTPKNYDVMQQFDLSKHIKPGDNAVSLSVNGETNMTYQIVGRHHVPRINQEAKQSSLELKVTYNHTELTMKDLLRAHAVLKNNGKEPTSQVIVELGIAPGFEVNAEWFQTLIAEKKIERFEIRDSEINNYPKDM